MGRLARVALVVSAAAAAYGARLWRENSAGKDVWATATDDLPEDADGVEPARRTDRSSRGHGAIGSAPALQAGG